MVIIETFSFTEDGKILVLATCNNCGKQDQYDITHICTKDGKVTMEYDVIMKHIKCNHCININ